MDLDIQRIITKALERANEDRKKPRELGRYYPSECWSCLRQKWFRWFEYPEEKGSPLGVFEMGRRTEDAFFDMLKLHYSEERVANNIRFKIELPEYVISGETDPVVYKDEKKKEIQLLFEVKSSANIAPTKEAHDNHIRQIMCYLKGLKLKSGYIIYINRSDLADIKSFRVDYDEDIWQSIVLHLDLYHEYLTSKEIPPAQPCMPEWECRYCPYTRQCIEVDKKKEC